MPGERYDDAQLEQYLLGEMPPDESERLDELSIADEETSWRVQSLEDELVDAYARGELKGDRLARFKSTYLRGEQKQNKVAVARALLELGNRENAQARNEARQKAASRTESVRRQRWVARFLLPDWGYAATAAAVVIGVLAFQNATLRRNLTNAQHEAAAERSAQEQLRASLQQQQAASNGSSAAQIAATAMVPSILLLPPTRGIGPLPTFAIAVGTKEVNVRLQVEANDFPTYQGTLRDSESHVLWRSGIVHAAQESQRQIVSFNLSTSLFQQRDYTIELVGIGQGSREIVGSYSFRVVLK